MSERVKRICAQCGKTFDLGWNGVCPDGVNLCDACFGIEREPEIFGALRHIIRIMFFVAFLALLAYAAWK